MAEHILIGVSRDQLINMKAYHLQMAQEIDKMLQTRKAGVSTSGSRKGKSERALRAATAVSINLKKSLLKHNHK